MSSTPKKVGRNIDKKKQFKQWINDGYKSHLPDAINYRNYCNKVKYKYKARWFSHLLKGV